MPTTKKEGFYFGFIMCFGMVTVMTLYNLMINGLIGEVSLAEILVQYVIGFVIAFGLELMVVGPAARKIVYSMSFVKTNKIYMVLAMAFCMVTGVVLCMSLFGLVTAYVTGSITSDQLVMTYLHNIMMNFMAALPLQLLIMGPIVRYVFTKYIKEMKFVKTA